jgi:hypothetical protein
MESLLSSTARISTMGMPVLLEVKLMAKRIEFG